jgi:hypothetical protein
VSVPGDRRRCAVAAANGQRCWLPDNHSGDCRFGRVDGTCACGRAPALWSLFDPPVCLQCAPGIYERMGLGMFPDENWQHIADLVGELQQRDPLLAPALSHLLLRIEAAVSGVGR